MIINALSAGHSLAVMPPSRWMKNAQPTETGVHKIRIKALKKPATIATVATVVA
jgi:hypothetical protein